MPHDWYEYTWVRGEVPFGGNTAQVEKFGFPMTSRPRRTSSGRVAGDVLTSTENGAGPFTLRTPTSYEVLSRSGATASGYDTGRQLGAEFRAVFLHTIGIGGRAYGFPYDDVNDQPSVRILGNSAPPTGPALGIGW
ncbi:hypothetical protein [Streptomyces sp. NPDC057939]|uniref:hypothetical protein n=1 Tax=Streptomyces sp. NPDC057939 TaxID=3346284 RepID=UPI0036E0179C